MTTQGVHIEIGSSSTSRNFTLPFVTYYNKNKVQYIITKEELALFNIEGGNLLALSLKASSISTRGLRNFRIRVKNTDKAILSTWETAELTLVYENINLVASEMINNEFYKFDFIEPFELNGNNLLIEVSRDDNGNNGNEGTACTRTGFDSGKMIGWRADGSYSYPFDTVGVTSFNYILDTVLYVDDSNYKSNGNYTSETIIITKDCKLHWAEEKPVGTDILVEYTKDNGANWLPIQNGGIIAQNNNLKIKITLSTTDEKETPSIKNIWLEGSTAPQDKILLTFRDLSPNRFNNVEGELSVSYSATEGNLKGRQGFVESFESKFLPVGLEPKPNPHEVENITATMDMSAKMTRVYHTDYSDYNRDKIAAGIGNITAEMIHISIANPL